MKILGICWENGLEFVEECNILRISGMISIRQVMISIYLQSFARWDQNEENFEKFKKILRFFDQNLDGKLRFFTIFYYLLLGFLSPLRKFIPLGDHTRFLQKFLRFRGGGWNVPGPPPPSRPLRRGWMSLLMQIIAFIAGFFFIQIYLCPYLTTY